MNIALEERKSNKRKRKPSSFPPHPSSSSSSSPSPNSLFSIASSLSPSSHTHSDGQNSRLRQLATGRSFKRLRLLDDDEDDGGECPPPPPSPNTTTAMNDDDGDIMQEEENVNGNITQLVASSYGGTMIASSATMKFCTSQQRGAALELELHLGEKERWDTQFDHKKNTRGNFSDNGDDDALTQSAMTTSAVASPRRYHHISRCGATRSPLHPQHHRLRRRNTNLDEDGNKMKRRNAVTDGIPSSCTKNEETSFLDYADNTISDPLVIAAQNATAIAHAGGFEGGGAGSQRQQRERDEQEQHLQNLELHPTTTATVLLMNDCSCSSVTEEDEEDDEEEDDEDARRGASQTMPARPPMNDILGGLHRERQSRQQPQLYPPPYVHHWPHQLQAHEATASEMSRTVDMEELEAEENVHGRPHFATENDVISGFNGKIRNRVGNSGIVTNELTLRDEELSKRTAASSLSQSSNGAATDPTAAVPKWRRTVVLPSHSSLY